MQLLLTLTVITFMVVTVATFVMWPWLPVVLATMPDALATVILFGFVLLIIIARLCEKKG